MNDMRELRMQAQKGVEIGRNDTIGDANGYQNPNDPGKKVAEELRILLEACVKNNFGGIESARLYSQTYYGTKSLVQEYVEEGVY